MFEEVVASRLLGASGVIVKILCSKIYLLGSSSGESLERLSTFIFSPIYLDKKDKSKNKAKKQNKMSGGIK